MSDSHSGHNHFFVNFPPQSQEFICHPVSPTWRGSIYKLFIDKNKQTRRPAHFLEKEEKTQACQAEQRLRRHVRGHFLMCLFYRYNAQQSAVSEPERLKFSSKRHFESIVSFVSMEDVPLFTVALQNYVPRAHYRKHSHHIRPLNMHSICTVLRQKP